MGHWTSSAKSSALSWHSTSSDTPNRAYELAPWASALAITIALGLCATATTLIIETSYAGNGNSTLAKSRQELRSGQRHKLGSTTKQKPVTESELDALLTDHAKLEAEGVLVYENASPAQRQEWHSILKDIEPRYGIGFTENKTVDVIQRGETWKTWHQLENPQFKIVPDNTLA